MSLYPAIASFEDAILKADQLIEAVKNDTNLEDTIYEFKICLDIDNFDNFEKCDKKCYVAGGSAVSKHVKILKAIFNRLTNDFFKNKKPEIIKKAKDYLFDNANKLCILNDDDLFKLIKAKDLPKNILEHLAEDYKLYPWLNLKICDNFKASDTDVFFVGSSEHYRFKADIVDFVYTKFDTVQNMLINFDLPCCRAAYDHGGKYYISAHCLVAIFTGNYYMPKYVEKYETFKTVFFKYFDGSSFHTGDFMHKRLIQRMTKYQKRGFNVTYIETDAIPKWIETRSHYAEWKKPYEVKNENIY